MIASKNTYNSTNILVSPTSRITMIKFKTVKLKNFLSVGDNPLAIYLDKSPTTLVSGKNGTGKTSIMTDSICFALFGKAFRNIKKQKLINSINQKDSVIELEFISGSDAYKIIRGQKPNLFEIYVNGNKLHENASVADSQSYLENHVLKFDYNVFSRLVVMSSMNYVPFLHLAPHERRKFVESILNLSVFSEMANIHKQNLAVLKDKLKSVDTEISTLESLIQTKNDFAAYIKNTANNKDRKDKFQQNVSNIERIREDLDSLRASLEDSDMKPMLASLKESQNTSRLNLSALEKSLHTNKLLRSEHAKKLAFIRDNCSCDKCQQTISEAHKTTMIADLEQEIAKYDNEISTVTDEFNDTTTKLSQIIADIKKHEECISVIEKQKLIKETELKQILAASKELMSKIAESSNDSDMQKLRAEIETLTDTLTTAQNNYEKLKLKNKISNIASDLLKDDGIKAEIIKQYIPVLVKYTNHYLSKMQLPLQFSMDELFNEQIITRYADEFEYNSLSAGERARVDIALNLAWIKTAKIKGGINTNLLVLDEIADNALDQTGSLAMFDIIANELGNEGMNVFIISHKANLEENVRSILSLEKVNGFTKIV